jgi:para-aminobenzoate synthetase component 1
MNVKIEQIEAHLSPESLADHLRLQPGRILLRTGTFEDARSSYSFLAVKPFLIFKSKGSICEISYGSRPCQVQFGNPWHVLDSLLARYELLEEADVPFPLGGCFGFWGFDLKNFVEPKLPHRTLDDLELPDCHAGFYDSLVVFDHRQGSAWIVATGLAEDGTRSQAQVETALSFWRNAIHEASLRPLGSENSGFYPAPTSDLAPKIDSTFTKAEFIQRVQRASDYIHAGDVYQVNLSQRLHAELPMESWSLFAKLLNVSPAPFAGFYDCGDFQLLSSSPESFLRISGGHIQTRPIKGTRPRGEDATRDAQLGYELQTSSKEMAELVMITDLLRNDLGKVCEFGSVQVPELARLERYPHVQHLVSTVEGILRPGATHFAAFASCFPGGSISGAPKFRALEIIDELEPVVRGPYTGSMGYLGFNRESQLNILIRTAICRDRDVWFHAGAGIVADSDPAAEYDETMAKAKGFLQAISYHEAASPFR